MSGIRGRAKPGDVEPVRRWCADCQDFTVSIMIDGQEECENHPYGFEDDDDE